MQNCCIKVLTTTIFILFCFRLVNESLQMLTRYPELNTKILPLMEDYLVALRYEMSCSEDPDIES